LEKATTSSTILLTVARIPGQERKRAASGKVARATWTRVANPMIVGTGLGDLGRGEGAGRPGGGMVNGTPKAQR
jgi:hypothetical protein